MLEITLVDSSGKSNKMTRKLHEAKGERKTGPKKKEMKTVHLCSVNVLAYEQG
jgi:hypothetical protein